MFVAGVPGSWLLRLPGGPDEVPDLGTGGARSQGPGGGQAPWALPGGHREDGGHPDGGGRNAG